MFQNLWVDVVGNAAGIESCPRDGDGLAVYVRGKDLNFIMLFQGLLVLGQQNGQGIGFLSRGTRRGPGTDYAAFGLIAENLGDDLFIQCLKCLWITKKLGHPNEKIPKKGLHLRRCLLEKLDVIHHILNLMDGHAALDTTQDGVGLVLGKIVTCVGPKQDKNFFKGDFHLVGGEDGCRGRGSQGMGYIGHDLGRHLTGRELIIHQTRVNGTSWHAVVFSGIRSLGHGHAAFTFNGPKPHGAVTAGA